MTDQTILRSPAALLIPGVLGVASGFAVYALAGLDALALTAVSVCMGAYSALLVSWMTLERCLPLWRVRAAALGAGLAVALGGALLMVGG